MFNYLMSAFTTEYMHKLDFKNYKKMFHFFLFSAKFNYRLIELQINIV